MATTSAMLQSLKAKAWMAHHVNGECFGVYSNCKTAPVLSFDFFDDRGSCQLAPELSSAQLFSGDESGCGACSVICLLSLHDYFPGAHNCWLSFCTPPWLCLPQCAAASLWSSAELCMSCIPIALALTLALTLARWLSRTVSHSLLLLPSN